MMTAVICARYGAPDVLQLTLLPVPLPKANEVRIRIRATTVTVADFRIRSFTVPRAYWIPARLALGITCPRNPVLGVEMAGDIDALGSNVKDFQPGEAVYAAALTGMGGYAQYICLPAKAIARKPPSLSYEEAAAIPIGASTALHFLQKANIQRGQHVMIYGASGSVGTYALQLAKYFGATVTAVCSGKNRELVESLGADQVIDYTLPGFVQQLDRYDIVLVAVDKIPFDTCLLAMKEEGVYLNVTAPFQTRAMIWASLTSKKKFFTGQNKPGTAADFQFLNERMEAGQLRVVVDRNYSLDQIVEAHRYVEAGHKKGNVTVTVK